MATDLRMKEDLPDLTRRILETYQTIGKINHLGHCPLPSLNSVIEIVDDLKEVLFPGYRRRQNLHSGNVAFHVGNLVDALHDSLTQQIARALRHDFDLRNETECGAG
ncbi:MAG: serine acetyltransferase, partial [Planctomycetaceae bacterium]